MHRFLLLLVNSIFLRSFIYILTIVFQFICYSNVFAQCIEGDCINGKGTYFFTSGSKYIGNFLNGEIHGEGTCYYKDGSIYVGNWSHRFPEGNGILTLKDGSIKKGIWKKGQLIDSKSTINEGISVQSGCIQGDCKNGKGTFAYPDGSKYIGNFVDNKLDGEGVWYYTNGDTYIGSFKNNYPHGKGKLLKNDKSSILGYWENGEYKNDTTKIESKFGCTSGNCINGYGTFFYKENGSQYTGTFKDGLPQGFGTVIYNNGEKYVGEWYEGSFNGLGTLYLVDSTKYCGNWSNGTFVEEKLEKIADTVPKVEPIFIQHNANPTKIWVLVIGIASYYHMPPLKYTDDDAYRMYAFYKSPEGGSILDNNIKLLIDEDATYSNIKNALSEISESASSTDNIIIFFSGHGLKGSFLPIDFDGENNKLTHEEINNILNKSKANLRLLIADACHSGSIVSMKGVDGYASISNYYKDLKTDKPGFALILSSKSEETSLESSGLRQGVFSHFLIRGLNGEADSNMDFKVTVQELYDFVVQNVRSYTINRQSPVIQGSYDPNMVVSARRK